VSEEVQDRVQEFLEACTAENEQITKELKEVDMLIRQQTSEVDKMAQQNVEITNRLRQIENNIDTVPREDIQNTYNAAQSAQGRLYTMRNQLEILETKRDTKKEYQAMLNRIIGLLSQLDSGAESGVPGAGNVEFTPAQSMVVRIIEAQETEKEKLARQMHDGPAQRLTNLILQAEICQRLFKRDPARAEEELENLKTAVNTTFQRTRTFIADLRPMMLDDLGLVPALRQYMGAWSDKTGIPAEFSFSGREQTRLASYNEVTIFRAVQEFMNNAAAHANPSRLTISLNLDGNVAQAIIEDDGVGFDVDEAIAASEAQKTIGISTMMERVQMLGGTLNIESVFGRGTKVVIEIPQT